MKKNIRSGLMFVCLLVFVFSAWQFWGIIDGYQKGNDSYSSLEQYVTYIENTGMPTTHATVPGIDPSQDGNTVLGMPDINIWPKVDFAKLSEINPDVVGWIYIEGTNINYPIVQGVDNHYYLKRLFDGTDNSAGCIFLDYRCSPDFSDQHSIIYGHHMKNKSMFSGLMDYKDQSFYEEHSIALLVTPKAYYKIQFFSGYISDNQGNGWELGLRGADYTTWLRELQEKSCFESDSAPTPESRIITLSTCTYEFTSAKFLLHGYVLEMIENSEP